MSEPNTQPADPLPDQALDIEPVEFEESELPDEPEGDCKIVLPCGMALRERFMVEEQGDAGLANGNATPMGFVFKISHAQLDEADAVKMSDGRYLISSAHEMVLSAEELGRLGTADAVEEARQQARQVAAAYAQRKFRGLELSQLLTVGAYRPVAPSVPEPELPDFPALEPPNDGPAES